MCSFSYLYPIIRIYPLDVVRMRFDLVVKQSFLTNSKLSTLLQLSPPIMTRQRHSFTTKYVWNKLLNWFCSAFSIWELSTCCARLLMLSCKRLVIGERTKKNYPYQLLWRWIVETLKSAKGNVLPSSYKVLTSTKHRMDNWWLVLTLREWYNDSKAQILAETREICGAWEGNQIYMYAWHTI